LAAGRLIHDLKIGGWKLAGAKIQLKASFSFSLELA